MTNNYIDVWFRFANDADQDPECEANTRKTNTGYAIDWCHIDVGQVSTVHVDTLAEVHDWYSRSGYQDFTA